MIVIYIRLFGVNCIDFSFVICISVHKLNRGPSIDASYHVSVHLAKRCQRRRYLEIDQSETRIACGSHVCDCIFGDIFS
jgi:hypothetical protein